MPNSGILQNSKKNSKSSEMSVIKNGIKKRLKSKKLLTASSVTETKSPNFTSDPACSDKRYDIELVFVDEHGIKTEYGENISEAVNPLTTELKLDQSETTTEESVSHQSVVGQATVSK